MTAMGIELKSELPTEKNLRHLKSFIVAYAVAVLASAATMALVLTGVALVEVSWADLLNIPAYLLLTFLLCIIGAIIYAFPAILVGYPIAVCVARRLSATRTALLGALIAPIVGTAAQLVFFSAIYGPHPAGLSTALWLLPGAAAAGAATGWTVAMFERRR